MIAYQAGDVAAFEELVVRYERPLWGYLRRFVRDGAVAEDLLQEIFLRVVRAAEDWRQDARFAPWVYTVARNLCTDHARRVATRRARSLDAPAQPLRDDDSSPKRLLDRLDSKTPGSEREALSRELREHLDRAIDELPRDQREVFILREMMDLPFAEIAATVGAPEGTVKSRMSLALQKLREAMATFHEAGQPTAGEPTQASTDP